MILEPLTLIYFAAVILIGLISIRTLLKNLKSWQRFDYRIDRLCDFLMNTKEGRRDLFSFWFFPGKIPRPKFTNRIKIIGLILLIMWAAKDFYLYKIGALNWPIECWLVLLIIWERTLWLQVAVAVKLSDIPVGFQKQRAYKQAQKIIENSNTIRIGITGSFGKSTTKELLVHLLKQHFGAENIFYNPENLNNEFSIARQIINKKDWFNESNNHTQPRFVVMESGAYKRGEIIHVAQMIQPQQAILTALGNQHLALFGSLENIKRAKFEMAEQATRKVFFNADNPMVSEVFSDNEIKGVKVAISAKVAQNVELFIDKTEFTVYGERMVLPWGGDFFIMNALLALECARELGVKPDKMAEYLPSLPALERALRVQQWQETNLLIDLYSANQEGVLGAIKHLCQFSGHKIFVGRALKELGSDGQKVHQHIFRTLKEQGVTVFWMEADYLELGRHILGDLWQGDDVKKLADMALEQGKEDAILLESRLPNEVTKMFLEEFQPPTLS